MQSQTAPPLIVLTDPALDTPTSGGVYLLHMMVREPLCVVFGRFRRGAVIALSAGDYAYVGSAMGGLGRRLLRHATRSDASAHPVRPALIDHFGLTPPPAKKKEEGREFIKDKRVIYIYHDRVDAIGDDSKTEAHTFLAVRQAIDELAALVGHIVNNLNGHHTVSYTHLTLPTSDLV